MRLHFAEFCFDTDRRELTRNGELVHLTTKALQLFAMLIEQRPKILPKKQIYADLNDMLLDEAYIICMSPTTNRLITTSKVQGVTPTLHSAQKWWDVWLADRP